MNMYNVLRNTTAISLVLASLATLTATTAQAAAAVDTTVEEVVVTIRKRPELLQDVPQSVQAMSGEQLERLGVSDMGDVAKFSPSVIFDKSASSESGSITIRGLSPTRGRANAAILIDGIDATSEAVNSSGGGALLNTRLLDIQRVEIARGPQAVEYGRSAFGGAIQYVTKDASDEFEARIGAEVGDYKRYDLTGSVNLPIAPGLGVRMTANYWEDGGFYDDEATRSPLGGGEGYGLAMTTNWNPMETLSFKGRLEYFNEDFAPDAQVLIRSNSGLLTPTNNAALAQAVAGGVTSAAPFAVFQGVVPDAGLLGRPRHSPDPLTGKRFKGSSREISRATLVSNWDIGFGDLTSWTSFVKAEHTSRQDYDQDSILTGPLGSQVDSSERGTVQDSKSETKQFSQELRFASGWEGPIQLTAGGLIWKEESERSATTVTVACARTIAMCANGTQPVYAQINYTPDTTHRETDHWSVYGMLDWAINDALTFTAAARYAQEDEEVSAANCGLPRNRFGVVCGDPFATSAAQPPVFGPSTLLGDRKTIASFYSTPLTVKHDENYLTPQFTLKWKRSPDQMYYLSASKGLKPGGTSTVLGGAWMDSDLDGDVDEIGYKAEKLWAYEAGAKLVFFDGILRANAAVFYQDYTDKQVYSTVSTPSGFPIGVTTNAGAARVTGAELEAIWRITPALRLSGGYTFLDTEYTAFSPFTDAKGGIVTAGNCEPVRVQTKMVCKTDMTGNELEKAPRHAAVATLSYKAPSALGDGIDWLAEVDGIYQSKRFIDAANTRYMDGYATADIRVGLSAERWDFTFYVDNVFDDDTVKSAEVKTGDVDRVVLGINTSTSVVLATLPDPRTFGVRLNFKY
ncbi:MAG: TonB-dependent receptor [Pseudomonadota bacterium]|uniref:TonB-dependent receptor n=1 Tax=Phenylobacterium sp. TaxID=1871053 RepID=UPI0025DA6E48|nr:TonB-dependent receptor [Phenylobacterium sp.]MBT9470523.1 TonB-dependent receptor [Phenylobacterium sp.]